ARHRPRSTQLPAPCARRTGGLACAGHAFVASRSRGNHREKRQAGRHRFGRCCCGPACAGQCRGGGAGRPGLCERYRARHPAACDARRLHLSPAGR
ncbi:MAG: hypothetical protein AVDCRST_MAG71-3019, partial [uncultured Lysobacter sp.]